MKHTLVGLGTLGALFTLVSFAGAQPAQLPEPLLAQGFEQDLDAGTWLGMGTTAKVSTEHAPENVKVDEGSLRFDYGVAPGQTNILVSAFATRSLATLASISFWIKVNHNASFVFALQEQGGGRFGTVFSVVKNQWQRVEIAPEDLVLQTDRDAPKDADGKLDLSKIEGVALIDFSQLLVQLAADPNSPLVKMLGIEAGPRTLFLDDLTLSSKPLSATPPNKAVLDDFKHPQAGWLGVGDVSLKTLRPDAPANSALQADYTQTQGHVTAIGKLLPAGVLEGKTSLLFDLASKKRTTLIVQLEETSGGKYNTVFEAPGDTTPSLQTLPFADFRAADDSRDDDNRLDVGQVKQVLIIDAAGLLGMGDGENTLWLSQLRVK